MLDQTSVSDSRPSLMIADDDPVVRSMLSMSLGEAFRIVGTANDGESAVELASASRPDVALIDVEMPAGGGAHAVRGVRSVAPKTAIVVLSGDESDRMVRDLMQAGATTYQRKGIPAHDLTAALMASIKAHASEQQTSA